MLSPPSLKNVPHYPITASVIGAAVVITLMWWSGQEVDAAFMDYRVWDRWQIWRGLTATLPHASFFHLAFNLYWTWTFGTLVERVYGHLKCLGIFLLLAMGSMLAEFAVLDGGVGLSGLGYGLWGMIFILERHDPRFAYAVDRQTNQMFAVWFVLCIVLTVANIMPVANIAHGVGAILGILLGWFAYGNQALKWKSGIGLAALFSLILLGSTVLWPWVNLSKDAGDEIERAALAALDRNDTKRGIQLLTLVTHRKNVSARAWYNLGVAYNHAGRNEDAFAAYEHAVELPDADSQMREVFERTRQELQLENKNR